MTLGLIIAVAVLFTAFAYVLGYELGYRDCEEDNTMFPSEEDGS